MPLMLLNPSRHGGQALHTEGGQASLPAPVPHALNVFLREALAGHSLKGLAKQVSDARNRGSLPDWAAEDIARELDVQGNYRKGAVGLRLLKAAAAIRGQALHVAVVKRQWAQGNPDERDELAGLPGRIAALRETVAHDRAMRRRTPHAVIAELTALVRRLELLRETWLGEREGNPEAATLSLGPDLQYYTRRVKGPAVRLPGLPAFVLHLLDREESGGGVRYAVTDPVSGMSVARGDTPASARAAFRAMVKRHGGADEFKRLLTERQGEAFMRIGRAPNPDQHTAPDFRSHRAGADPGGRDLSKWTAADLFASINSLYKRFRRDMGGPFDAPTLRIVKPLGFQEYFRLLDELDRRQRRGNPGLPYSGPGVAHRWGLGVFSVQPVDPASGSKWDWEIRATVEGRTEIEHYAGNRQTAEEIGKGLIERLAKEVAPIGRLRPNSPNPVVGDMVKCDGVGCEERVSVKSFEQAGWKRRRNEHEETVFLCPRCYDDYLETKMQDIRRNPGAAWHQAHREHYEDAAAGDLAAGHDEAAQFWKGAAAAESSAVSQEKAAGYRANPDLPTIRLIAGRPCYCGFAGVTQCDFCSGLAGPARTEDAIKELKKAERHNKRIAAIEAAGPEGLRIGRTIYRMKQGNPGNPPERATYKGYFGIGKRKRFIHLGGDWFKMVAGGPVGRGFRAQGAGTLADELDRRWTLENTMKQGNPTARQGFQTFHHAQPDRARQVYVPPSWPKKLWMLGKHKLTILQDGTRITGGTLAAATGSRMFIIECTYAGRLSSGARAKQIEYVAPAVSERAGPLWFHPFDNPPPVRETEIGYLTLAGKGIKLTRQGIVG